VILADVTYYEPWWMQIAKSLVIFFIVFNFIPIALLAERKLLGRFQGRYGPNRVGPFGVLQPIADILKLVSKEDFRPRTSQALLYTIAPVLSVIAAVGAVVLIPFGDTVDIFGTTTGLYGMDVAIGPLFVFALGAIAFYGLMLGGWASGSKYSFLGSMRAAAQLISYEVSQGLALIGVVMTAVATIAIIPFSDTVDIFGTQVGLYGIDPSVGILYAFAFGAIAFYGLMLGGWASGSKYSFLGSMRGAAQLISYEVAQGLSLVGVIMMAGSLSLTEIVNAQSHLPYVIPQFVGFIIFLVATLAETNRPPFDLAEADAELVQGYMTEYGGSKFGAYYMAEYLNMIVASLLIVTFFLGGWWLPFGIHPPTWVYPIVVLGKMLIFVYLFIWVRATLPRPRYDQLMSLGWKVLLPLATLNALVTAIIVVVTD